MVINNNPYTSGVFERIWRSHFGQGQKCHRINFIKGLFFISHPTLPYRTNIGRNHTKGISYEIVPADIGDLGAYPVLIYDVPAYFKLSHSKLPENVGNLRIKQYQGFLIDLKLFKNLEEYLKENFSKSSRYKLKKYKRRLEASFDVSYTMHSGIISQEVFDRLFEQFRVLLQRRFEDKQETNNNLDPAEWAFYKESTYALMKEKQAGLFVVYSEKVPISMTLVHLADSLVFDAITVFDIDYSRFHLGSVTIMGLIEWCLQNGYRTLDFSKGYFSYKARWATEIYDFEYHIYYNKNKPASIVYAKLLQRFLVLKNSMRQKGYHKLFRSFKYKITQGLHKNPGVKSKPIVLESYSSDEPLGMEVDWTLDEHKKRLRTIYDFIFLTGDSVDRVHFYKPIKKGGAFVIYGQDSGKVARI